FLAQDPETRVIGLYLESMAKGRKFLAALANCPKPVVLHKANTAPESQLIAQSHTAALAVDDQIVDAACRRAGVFRARSFQQFINYAKAFALPPMRGDKLMVISRSGGHAVVSADAAAAEKFCLPPLTADFVEKISSQFRAAVIKPTNPLDLGDIFNIDYYITILEMSLARADVDGILFNHVFQAESEAASTRRLAREVENLSRRYDKPVALVLFSSESAIAALLAEISLPIFAEPLLAVEALGASRRRSAFLARPGRNTALPRPTGIRPRPLYEEWLAAAGRRDQTLFADQALTLVGEYGLPTAGWSLARDGRELLEEGEDLGFPLVLKAVVAGLTHKSDVGGVLTGIRDAQALADVGRLLFDRFAKDAGFCGVLLQKEVDTRLEMIVGARRDPSFGEVFVFGMGGIYAEILRDVAMAPGPLDCELVREMVEGLRGAAILGGARGQAGIDFNELNRVLGGLQALLEDYPAISEIEINPLVFSGGRALIVDARIVTKVVT
ncbi:MAG: acetate--CoA ligase family protein, partial [Deltaproteobacteria bacterium]|nr:acetate--CoA ligase family protein [Deltaproteobacteria bacterium]